MVHKLKIKCVDSRVNVHNLSSTDVPFTLTTVQVPNLALTHKKRITVYSVDVFLPGVDEGAGAHLLKIWSSDGNNRHPGELTISCGHKAF
jgi:hypothetical protein